MGVVQILDFVQEGRHLLNLIHTYDSRALIVGFEDLREDMRVPLQIEPRPAFLEVENPCIRVRNSLEQCGFSGLPRSEEEANLVP